MHVDVDSLQPGFDLPVVERHMTQERMSVFSDMEEATVKGRMVLAPTNIHKDLDFAMEQGLPNTIADGLISTAFTERILREILGMGYLQGGALHTKFIRPVYAGDILRFHGRVTGRAPEGDAERVVIEFAWHNQEDAPVTVGSASGLIRP